MNSSAIRATEDVLSRRPVHSGGRGFAFQQPPSSSLCPECAALLAYSLERIDACRYGASKPQCARCATHCFRPAMRERIRAAMRWSGPRMTYRQPYLAMRHLLDRRRAPGVPALRTPRGR